MTVSSFPFKESESSLFTSVARNLRPTCANPPPPPPSLLQCSVFRIPEAYLFQAHLRGGGGGFIEEGGLI